MSETLQPDAVRDVVVFDSNIDALSRRVGALEAAVPDVSVTATASRTAVLVLAAAARPSTPVLVDLCVTDGPSLDRPGERLIQRLARTPQTDHVRPIAWSAHVGPEVVAGVRAAGGAGFVTATLRREREADELREVLNGAAVWPQIAPSDDGEWEAWFRATYDAAWAPWMEPILVRLAAGLERRSVAADLVAVGAARSANHAAARMREIARLIAGEHSNSAPAVAKRAAVVLARLAARRPLVERPTEPVSLARGAAALRTSPSLAVAAALTPVEVEDVLTIDTLIRGYRATATPSPGAPHADRVRDERRWAAGRMAVEQSGGGAHGIDEVIAGILTRVDDALASIDDALEDAPVHPAPRAAAALLALQASTIRTFEDVTFSDGILRWQGLSPAEVAVDEDHSSAVLRELTAEIDRRLVTA